MTGEALPLDPAGDVAVRSGEVKVRSPWGQQVPPALRIDLTGSVASGNITARPAGPSANGCAGCASISLTSEPGLAGGPSC
jgi:hypothetical protein